MLKKMRRRFITAAMASFFVVMTVLLVAINVINYSITARSQDSLLAAISGAPSRMTGRPREDRRGGRPQAPFASLFFKVRLDGEGQAVSVFSEFSDSVSEEEALHYAELVLEKGKTSGYLGDYRFLVREDEVIFLNSAPELKVVRTVLYVSFGVEVISLLAVFLLLWCFSRRAIAPYARNIEQQKQFITDASHELKTPLTSISTSADVLAMELSENEWVENIQKQCGRLTRLVGHMVTLSRLDEENPLPEKADFSLSDAAWEIAEPFVALAKTRGKSFEADIEDGLTYRGDKGAIQQMLSILLDNAVKYSDERGEIRLDVHRKHKNIQILVTNSCDLPADLDISRLFDRFYRPDQSRSAHTGGTGIGLAIAKAIVSAYGGRISAARVGEREIQFRVVLS